MGDDLDLALALLADDDIITEVVGAALDLDAVLEELLEGGDVEDLVASRLLSVDDELKVPVSFAILQIGRSCSMGSLPSSSAWGPWPSSSAAI